MWPEVTHMPEGLGPSPEEMGISPEVINEPTSAELASACQEVLGEEDRAELAGMDFSEALDYAFTLLIENGVDPEAFLKEKKILE